MVEKMGRGSDKEANLFSIFTSGQRLALCSSDIDHLKSTSAILFESGKRDLCLRRGRRHNDSHFPFTLFCLQGRYFPYSFYDFSCRMSKEGKVQRDKSNFLTIVAAVYSFELEKLCIFRESLSTSIFV